MGSQNIQLKNLIMDNVDKFRFCFKFVCSSIQLGKFAGSAVLGSLDSIGFHNKAS